MGEPAFRTEAEWRECAAPFRLAEVVGPRLSRRKRLLFCCACWQEVGDLLGERGRRELRRLAELAESPLTRTGIVSDSARR